LGKKIQLEEKDLEEDEVAFSMQGANGY